MHVLRLLKTTLVEGDLRKLVTGMDKGAALQLVVALEPLRDMLVGLAQTPQLQQVPDLAPNLNLVAQKARVLGMQMFAGDVPSTTYFVEGNTPKTLLNCRTQSRRWFVLD